MPAINTFTKMHKIYIYIYKYAVEVDENKSNIKCEFEGVNFTISV